MGIKQGTKKKIELSKAVKRFCISHTGNWNYCFRCIVELSEIPESTLKSIKLRWINQRKPVKYQGKVKLRKLFVGFIKNSRMHNGRTVKKRKYWLNPVIKRVRMKKRKTRNEIKDDSLEWQFNNFLSKCHSVGM